MFDPSALPLDIDRLWSAGSVVFRYFDYFATFTWALSGAVLGARRGYDWTGIFAVALVSSCGGGLLRDAVFLQAGPPALVRTPAYVSIAFAASIVTWLAGARRLFGLRLSIARLAGVADALGLGAFAVVGMRLALAAKIGVPGAMLIGVVNAVGGGILRSLLLRRTPDVLKPGKLTALAALAGTLLYALLVPVFGLDERIAGALTIGTVAAIHWSSVRFRLRTHAAWSVDSRRRWLRRRAQPSAPTQPAASGGQLPLRDVPAPAISPRVHSGPVARARNRT